MKITHHKGFRIEKSKPSRKTICRIFQGEEYKATLYTEKGARRLIDFCLKHKVWK